MAVEPKVVNGLSRTFVCTMGMGPRINLYRIGGDPLTQLIFFNYIYIFYFLFFFLVFFFNFFSS